MKKYALLSLFLTLALGFLPHVTHAAEKLFYFRDTENGRTSLFTHADSIDILAPQTYKIDMNSDLQGSIDPNILLFARLKKIQVMPLVTNGTFDQISLEVLFGDNARQAKVIQQMVDEAKKFGYIGWQLDFEQMDIKYRDTFTAFVQKTYQVFKQNNLQLSVAVIAQTSENPTDYPRDLWTKLIGVYDYKALAQNSDFISIMSYDDPASKGPVAPFAWLERVVAHSSSLIPPAKISLGIPFYYWKWNNTTGKRVGIGGHEGIIQSFMKPLASVGYSPIEKTAFVTYLFNNDYYTVWYETAQSIKEKINLASRNNFRGFSAWVLGLESPEIYKVL